MQQDCTHEDVSISSKHIKTSALFIINPFIGSYYFLDKVRQQATLNKTLLVTFENEQWQDSTDLAIVRFTLDYNYSPESLNETYER